MPQREIERKEARLEEIRVVSPPWIEGPLYRCGPVVTVRGYEIDAEIDLEVDGTIVTAPGGFPEPHGVAVKVPQPGGLQTGWAVRARQRTPAGQSLWSNPPEIVRDHSRDYPAGPPRPQINPAPPLVCGVRTGVGNLLSGGNVWITANGAERGRVDGCQPMQGVNVMPAYGSGEEVRAWFELCSDPSPPSLGHQTQPPPAPLPTPGFKDVYADSRQVEVTNIANGARVTLSRAGAPVGTFPCWGGSILIGLATPVGGDELSAVQELCPDQPGSSPGTTRPKPCEELGAPVVAPVRVGDTTIVVLQWATGATITVYRNHVAWAKGSPPLVTLPAPVAHGDTLHVGQSVGSCLSRSVVEVTPDCRAWAPGPNPAALDLFPVGWFDFADGPVKGRVYYPAEDDGQDKPFNVRLAGVGRAPLVVMAHGNHYTWYDPNDRTNEACSQQPDWLPVPSHLGYVYLQQLLARMGIVAASVDCNATNCNGGGPQNIRDRADLIIGTIDHFRTRDATAGDVFSGRIDFGRTGLLGHSRGGDAVVLVPEVIGLPGVSIRAVLALAPTDFGASSGRPRSHAFMTILPAGDGDVRDLNGATFYDRAEPAPFKVQLHVRFANHNWFNREWPADDSLNYSPNPPAMARIDHEAVLAAYGCALFRVTLLGHGPPLRALTGDERPVGSMAQNVEVSFAWNEVLTVDDHEQVNGIGLNSLNAPTIQLMGLSADEHGFFQLAPNRFNDTFFGRTTGMVARSAERSGVFRSDLGGPTNLRDREVWIRAAEVADGSSTLPAGPTGFMLGIEDAVGRAVWVDSDGVGGLPRPYPRSPITKTMPMTFRFPWRCFAEADVKLDVGQVRAILLRLDRADGRALAFDDLQIVPER